MALPAFKNGKPLFKNGRPAFAVSPCTCCGSCTCAHVSASDCSLCTAGCTPTSIEAVLSGIATSCCAFVGQSIDVTVGTLAATVTCPQIGGSPCLYRFDDNTNSVFTFRKYASSSVCSGASSNNAWNLSVSLFLSAGVPKIRVNLNTVVAATAVIYFSGEVDLDHGCSGTYTINNGDGGRGPSTNCPGGGTITLTFCP